MDAVWRHWEGVFVIYQRASGETHAFNKTTAEILRCLQDGSLSLRDLMERVAMGFGTDPTEFSPLEFKRLLDRLEHLGMAERVDFPETGS